MRSILLLFSVLLTASMFAQKRDRFTLYDENSGAPKRIKEGRYIHMSILSDRCAGWESKYHTVMGSLLLLDDSSVTIFHDGEYLRCAQGDSTFNWTKWDIPEGTTLTIPNDRIQWIEKEQPKAGIVFAGIMGAAFTTILFVAPIASIGWFSDWKFNADTYTTITRNGLIVLGGSIPFAAAFSGTRRLVPKTHLR